MSTDTFSTLLSQGTMSLFHSCQLSKMTRRHRPNDSGKAVKVLPVLTYVVGVLHCHLPFYFIPASGNSFQIVDSRLCNTSVRDEVIKSDSIMKSNTIYFQIHLWDKNMFNSLKNTLNWILCKITLINYSYSKSISL